MLSKTGRGLHTLNPRQLCNLSFALQLEACDGKDEREEFLMDLKLPLDRALSTTLSWRSSSQVPDG